MNPFDRLKQAVFTLIEVAMRRVDYYALYPAKIIKQDAQGRLELQPEDVRLVNMWPGLTAVPIRLGLPGVKVTVPAGGRVLLGFEGGDPMAPVALLWDISSVSKLEIDATEIIFNGGVKKVALVGDNTSGHTHTVVVPPGAAGGTFPTSSASDSLTGGAPGVKA